MGVENITDMNLKDLEGILGNAKSLKRNNKAFKEILIVPSMFPRFASTSKTPLLGIPPTRLIVRSALGPNFAARMASRHFREF